MRLSALMLSCVLSLGPVMAMGACGGSFQGFVNAMKDDEFTVAIKATSRRASKKSAMRSWILLGRRFRSSALAPLRPCYRG